MRVTISKNKVRNNFVKKIEELSGQNLLACYQCGKCSAGCPAAKAMDILPNQIIRYAQLGFKDDLLSCNAIWMCASCLTCNSRCPKGINIAEIIEALRQYLLRQRKDHVDINEVSDKEMDILPPIAIISSLRKYTTT